MLGKKAFKLPPLISKFIHEKNSGVQCCTKSFACKHHPHEKPLDNFRRLESCSIIFLAELHSPKHGSLEFFRSIFLLLYIFFTSHN